MSSQRSLLPFRPDSSQPGAAVTEDGCGEATTDTDRKHSARSRADIRMRPRSSPARSPSYPGRKSFLFTNATTYSGASIGVNAGTTMTGLAAAPYSDPLNAGENDHLRNSEFAPVDFTPPA